MYTIKEQVILMVYFLILGVFSISLFKLFIFVLDKSKLKKVIKYIIEFIFWIFLTIIVSSFLFKKIDGYVPIYGICFYLLGIVIYLYLLDKIFKEDLNRVYLIINKLYLKTKKIWKIILPIEIIRFCKRIVSKKGDKYEKDNNSNDIND